MAKVKTNQNQNQKKKKKKKNLTILSLSLKNKLISHKMLMGIQKSRATLENILSLSQGSFMQLCRI